MMFCDFEGPRKPTPISEILHSPFRHRHSNGASGLLQRLVDQRRMEACVEHGARLIWCTSEGRDELDTPLAEASHSYHASPHAATHEPIQCRSHRFRMHMQTRGARLPFFVGANCYDCVQLAYVEPCTGLTPPHHIG